MRNPYSKLERNDAIHQGYDAGKIPSELARQFEVSKQRITAILRLPDDNGHIRRPPTGVSCRCQGCNEAAEAAAKVEATSGIDGG